MNPKPKSTKEAALAYAQRGWSIVPIHVVVDGACSCQRPDCSKPGKHPWTTHGYKDASAIPDDIHAWWRRQPTPNVAIVTGAVSGVVALDVDAQHNGFDTLARFTAQHGPLPVTVEARTGGGGRHYLFQHPGAPVKSRADAEIGLDVRGDGGMIVAAPSMHKSGRQYEWVEGREPGVVALAPCPAWILELAAGKKKAKNGSLPGMAPAAGRIIEGGRNQHLTSYAGRLRREGLEQAAIEALLIKKNASECVPPLDDEEVRSIAASVARYDPAPEHGFGEGKYVVEKGMIHLVKRPSGGGEHHEPIANFAAQIVCEVVLDDGGKEDYREFHVEGAHTTGRPFELVKVPSEKFEAMNWPMQMWGTQAIIAPGNGAKSHLRAAIQVLSPQAKVRRVFRHSGWRKLGDAWYYLHAGGAIGAEGTLPGIEISLEENLQYLHLPEPPVRNSEELREAVSASLKLLDLASNPIVGSVVLGGVYRAMLAEASPVTTGIWLEGRTGSFKTQLAALAQAHFGAEFWRDIHLPANWGSTMNAVERIAFVAKDALLVIDDFAPNGSTADIARLHASAERFIRGMGNGAGRMRMNADSTLRSTYVPRGFVLMTGEDVPRGQSIQARLVIVPIEPGMIPRKKLDLAQADAREGLYARAMSGFARWLAPRIDTMRPELRKRIGELREQVLRDSIVHARTPDAIASIFCAWELFLEYAQADAGLNPARALEIHDSVWDALLGTVRDQGALTREEDPVERFLKLLSGAIHSGLAHISMPDGSEPEHPNAWGWSRVPNRGSVDPNAPGGWQKNGKRLGFLTTDQTGVVYIFPEAAYSVAQEMGRSQGEQIGLRNRTLWKRMRTAKRLLLTEEGRNTVRRMFDGQRYEFLALDAAEFGGAAAKMSQWDITRFAQEGIFPTRDADGDGPDVATIAGPLRAAAGRILGVIDEICKKSGSNAPRSDILALAEPRSVTPDQAYAALDALVKAEILAETAEGWYGRK